MDVRFTLEPFAAIEREVLPLASAHWSEIGEQTYGRVETPISFPVWRSIEQAGAMHIVTARDDDGALKGYAAFCVGPHQNIEGKVQASCLALYVAQDMRRDPFVALRMLRWAEDTLRDRGVDCVAYVSQAERPCDAIYRRLGAKMTETTWFKEL
ncbi:MAG: GNAT family N-acetyltransferase [Desulfovibrio sp.]|nr:GNAT family N-acetyltransferase [Desulfovibrio sp.]